MHIKDMDNDRRIKYLLQYTIPTLPKNGFVLYCFHKKMLKIFLFAKKNKQKKRKPFYDAGINYIIQMR